MGESPRVLAGKYLTFKLLGESYGIDVMAVREIVHHMAINELTPMPCGICGAIHLRGHIVPVMDLCARCHPAGTLCDKENYIAVVQTALPAGKTATLGLMVDEMQEMVNISGTDIENLAGYAGAMPANRLIGIAHLPGGVTALLNPNGLVRQETWEELRHAA